MDPKMENGFKNGFGASTFTLYIEFYHLYALENPPYALQIYHRNLFSP